jgi:hypothetical protein
MELHMAKFGRPLWLAYGHPDHIARIKIIGGNPSRAYDAYNEIRCLELDWILWILRRDATSVQWQELGPLYTDIRC